MCVYIYIYIVYIYTYIYIYIKFLVVKRGVLMFPRGPGGFTELREADRNNFHLSSVNRLDIAGANSILQYLKWL